jgi:uncharacterized protein (TIGR03435 family)
MAFLSALTLIPALAQSDAGPSFEVASVKPAGPMKPGRPIGMTGGPGTEDLGQIHWNYVTLQAMLMRAYNVKEYDISGPAWLSTERYDIAAIVPAGTSKEQFQLMVRNLLVQRFKLKLHRETKEGTVYELTVGKNGPRFKQSPQEAPPESNAADPTYNGQPVLHHGADGVIELPPSMHGKGHMAIRSFMGTEIRVRREGLAYLIERLSTDLHRPVVDDTGLTGEYDYALKYTPESATAASAAAADDRPPDVFTALRSQLGLRLEPKKVPQDELVIDAVEKTPIEN